MFQHYSAFIHPSLIAVNFLLILYFIWTNRRVVGEALGQVHWSYYAGLIAIAAVLVFFYSFLVSPKHYMYTDEFVYEQAAKNILTQGNFGVLLKSQGWAFLISLGYIVAGLNNYVSIYLAEFLGVATIFGFFFMAVCVGAGTYNAFISTLIFAFLPARIFWAATGESHTAELFFTVLVMAFSFLFYRKQEIGLFWLSLMLWSFAIQVRGETVLLLGLFFLGIRLFIPNEKRRAMPVIDGLFICLCLTVPQLVLGIGHYSTQLSMAEGQQGIKTSHFFIFYNLIKYGPKFLLGGAHPFILSLMAGAGLVRLSLQRDRRVLFFLLSWLFLLTLIYFSMWLDLYGLETSLFSKLRLFLFFYPPLLLFLAFSLGKADAWPWIFKIMAVGIVAAGLVLWFVSSYKNHFLNHGNMEAQMKVVDYAEHSIPQKDIVVACGPEVFMATTSLHVVSADAFLNDPIIRRDIFDQAKKAGGRVLFAEDFGRIIFSDCRKNWQIIMEKSRAVPVKTFSSGNDSLSIDLLSAF